MLYCACRNCAIRTRFNLTSIANRCPSQNHGRETGIGGASWSYVTFATLLPSLKNCISLEPPNVCISSSPPYPGPSRRSEEHTSELQSLMRNSYAVFCLKKKTTINTHKTYTDI